MNSNAIYQYAEKIHNALGLEEDFDVEDVVIGLGGKIETCKLRPGIWAEMCDFSCDENKYKFNIKISSDTIKEERKRFSIAHELGHLFLHMDFLDDSKWKENCQSGINFNRSEASDSRKEIEANTFAAALLMPNNLFRSIVEQYTNSDGVCDINKVANKFKVSKQSAYYRGVNLGLWI